MKKYLSLALVLLIGAVALPALAQNINTQSGSSYTILNTDCSKIINFTASGTKSVTLPRASSAGGSGAASGQFMPPCRIEIVNTGASGYVVVTPTTSTINGSSSPAIVGVNYSLVLTSNGTNYIAQMGALY